MSSQIVYLHRDAPAKPEPGAPCNRCGMCCAAETCPPGRLIFRRRRGPCPALRWEDVNRTYTCGLVDTPKHHLRWLPHSLVPFAARLLRRWIAADSGCDAAVAPVNPQ